MGLKTINYKIKTSGITLPEAYALLSNLSVNQEGVCKAYFKIQQSRNDMMLDALNEEQITLVINKSQPLYEQVYNAAKNAIFVDWEDDIVEEIFNDLEEEETIEDEESLEEEINKEIQEDENNEIIEDEIQNL